MNNFSQETLKKYSKKGFKVFLVKTNSSLFSTYYQVCKYNSFTRDVCLSHIYFDFDQVLVIFNMFCNF